MNHLTNLYKNKCEQLQEQIYRLTRMLNEADTISTGSPTSGTVPPSGIDPSMFDRDIQPAPTKPYTPTKPVPGSQDYGFPPGTGPSRMPNPADYPLGMLDPRYTLDMSRWLKAFKAWNAAHPEAPIFPNREPGDDRPRNIDRY
jgi:hypothetical protein